MGIKAYTLSFILLLCSAMGSFAAEDTISVGGSVTGREAHCGFIYVSQRNSILIFNARDKKHVQPVGRFTENGRITKIDAIWPTIFYVFHHPGSYYSHVGSIDVTDPTHPEKVDLINASGSKYIDIATSGSTLLKFSDWVYFYDAAKPVKPLKFLRLEPIGDPAGWKLPKKPKRNLNLPKDVLFAGRAHNVKVIGKKAYVLDDQPGLKVIDVSDPKHPGYIGPAKDAESIRAQMKPKKSGSEKGLAYKGYKICVAEEDPNSTESLDYNSRMLVQKNSNPTHPEIVATVTKWHSGGTGTTRLDDYWLSGKWLIVCMDESTTAGRDIYIEVYDLTDPEHPAIAGTCDDLDNIPEQVCVQDGFIYIAEGKDGLSIRSLDF